ncbi:MAG: LysR family transcriptional regulator [Alphaproteobacteria bacterium]|nr:MAG: LysR family transcriptional regulator [Alphaproteobacteria bacterium]
MRQLNNVNTFLEVARTRSFAAAAKSLGLSTSATSKAVARLEEEFGVKLLHRTTRSVSLTAEGERFLEGAGRLKTEMDDLIAAVTESRGAPRGRITIGCTVILGRMWLAPLMVDFQRQYPDISVELRLEDRAADLAAEGLDLVVRAGELSDNSNLVARRFFEARFIMAASPDYLARRGTPTGIDDLDNHDCLSFRNPGSGRLYPWRFTFEGYSVSKQVPGRLVANEGDALRLAAEAGAGIVQMPSYVLAESLGNGKLVPVLPDLWPVAQPYHLLYLDRRFQSPRIRALIDFLTAHRPDWEAALSAICKSC